jgi:hypothetical protein
MKVLGYDPPIHLLGPAQIFTRPLHNFDAAIKRVTAPHPPSSFSPEYSERNSPMTQSVVQRNRRNQWGGNGVYG